MPPPSIPPDHSPAARGLLLELQIQRVRHGAGVMLTDKQLAATLGLQVRSIVDLAGDLIDAGHIVPASSDTKNPGRCLLKRGDDFAPALAYLKVLDSRGVKILWRRRRFRDALIAAGAGQLNLPLEEPA